LQSCSSSGTCRIFAWERAASVPSAGIALQKPTFLFAGVDQQLRAPVPDSFRTTIRAADKRRAS
jgi:hypothetical protein